METKIKIEIKCETDEIRLGYWHPDKDDWIELEIGDDLGEASEVLQCSEDLLNAVIQTMDILIDRIGHDLRSIWKRLDEIEKEG